VIRRAEMSYNGYTNWDTWAWALWVDNDYEIYQWKIGQLDSEDDDLTIETLKECEEVFDIARRDGIDLDEVDWDELLVEWEYEKEEHLKED